jgi:BNR/Asp-box repeat protein
VPRQRVSRVAALSAIAILATLVGPSLGRAASRAPSDCKIPAPAPLKFNKPVFIDQHLSGGEPVSVVAKDGSIVVGAHLGTTLAYLRTAPDADFYTGYRNQTLVWRSTDNGKTWKRSEIAPGSGGHSAMSTGFSDPDFARDAAGNLYGTEIDLANVSVFSSHDNGVTWPDANPIADSGDRPWLAARAKDEVYLRITGNLQKSTDGGKTWTKLTDPNAYGKIYIDPTDPKGLYAGSGNGVGVEVSRDDGMSWTSYPITGATNNSVMQSIGVDKSGFVYYGYVEKNQVKFASFDPKAKKWSTPVTIPRVGKGTPFWAWTVAGDDGRAAVAWYEATPVDGATDVYEVRAYAAATTNARGSRQRCPGGATVHVDPQFSVADVAKRPIHVGQLPCNGTGCNARGDRRLGDFFTINYDAKGRLFITTGDTTLKNAAGGELMVSRPLFVGATDSSPRLLGKH